jgi:hypothetical protein
MNHTHDPEEAATDDGGALDPREAARLLEQTSREARRQLSLNPPLVTAVMGLVILAAYVALWLPVLGQHPYSGSNRGVITLVYATVAVGSVVVVKVYQRARAGVSGPSVGLGAAEGIALLVSIGGSPVIRIPRATWRRERDSNPRGLGGPCGFQVPRLACCGGSWSAALDTNHDRMVVVKCRSVPPRAAAVGVRLGVVASAQDGLRRPPGGRTATAALRSRNRDARRTLVRRARGTRGGGQEISSPSREGAGEGERRKR